MQSFWSWPHSRWTNAILCAAGSSIARSNSSRSLEDCSEALIDLKRESACDGRPVSQPLLFFQHPEQPRAGEGPLAIDRAWRDFQGLGGLVDAQPGVEPQPDDRRRQRRLLAKALYGVVERQNRFGIGHFC